MNDFLSSEQRPSVCKRGLDGSRSQIVGCEPGALADSREHTGADLVSVVKRPDVVGPLGALKRLVRTRRSLDRPTNAKECGENSAGRRGTPGTHAAWKLT